MSKARRYPTMSPIFKVSQADDEFQWLIGRLDDISVLSGLRKGQIALTGAYIDDHDDHDDYDEGGDLPDPEPLTHVIYCWEFDPAKLIYSIPSTHKFAGCIRFGAGSLMVFICPLVERAETISTKSMVTFNPVAPESDLAAEFGIADGQTYKTGWTHDKAYYVITVGGLSR